ncbi:hypothetical protein [Photobacterium leiognathi]|uniref:hypothetical protein n=1 Tax=Photobacterium leiognathi TaxID=553611 RepID=UPI002980F16A|nr:hypothetical protein [Photobacterium leiognathi]
MSTQAAFFGFSEQGWDKNTKLHLLHEFLDQQDTKVQQRFSDFLQKQADFENGVEQEEVKEKEELIITDLNKSKWEKTLNKHDFNSNFEQTITQMLETGFKINAINLDQQTIEGTFKHTKVNLTAGSENLYVQINEVHTKSAINETLESITDYLEKISKLD